MKNLLFIVNPSAGRKHIKGKLFEIVDLFVKADYNVRVYPTQAKEDAMRIVSEEGWLYDLIVCAGGDGTLDEVVAGCMKCGCDTPVGYIPSGTTNDFARSLGIPKDPVRAAKRIVKYSPRPVDVGTFNGDYFIYVAAFGAFTDVTYTTPQEYKNYLGHAAYVLEGIKSVTNLTSYHLKIEYDGNVIEDDFFIGMITNSLTVGGFPNPNARIAEFDDGMYEALLVKYPTNPIDLQATVTAYMMGEFNAEYMYQFKAKRITIESPEAITWTLDGEFGGSVTYAEIVNLQHAVSIIRK
ncbi:MAG: YegS/Rv2252/BmrU family lipid kinase [Bacteroidales bacterium]|nr:YegS/Rv2252/BmrU family lipid kinase [Clostridium sp.]MCM1202941.1 YegS/Rv2252/BmrU family lipid kinase [Bacteroidales bacterium]